MINANILWRNTCNLVELWYISSNNKVTNTEYPPHDLFDFLKIESHVDCVTNGNSLHHNLLDGMDKNPVFKIDPN